MKLGFVKSSKKGLHYGLVKHAIVKLKTANLLVKGKSKNGFEIGIISHLEASPRLREKITTQIGINGEERISNANLFGFKHWPDASIGYTEKGNDVEDKGGTAIEIKVVSTGQDVNDILGQALAYRMYYRFVILVIVDQTEDKKVVELCQTKNSREYDLLSALGDAMNIFTVVGPVGRSENIAFLPVNKCH
jgi:hypothetical protein